MKSVKPKLKRRGGGCIPGASEAGGARVENLLNGEIGKVKEGGHVESLEVGQQYDTQLKNREQLEELKLAKRKLELELRELELEKREQMLKLNEEQKKKSPRKLFSRQIREINQNIVGNRPDGLSQASGGRKQAMQTNSRECDPDQEEECEQKDERSVTEDIRISELHDVVRKQQEILDKFHEERQEEKLSMKLIAELLLKEQKQQQLQKNPKKSGNWRQDKNHFVWKRRSMNSGFAQGREANVKKSVPPQFERGGNGYCRSHSQADQERSRLKSKAKDIGRHQTGIRYDRYGNIPVCVTGDDVTKKHLHPSGMFRDAGLSLLLLKNIDKCYYMEPTPVQQYAIPIILDGRDVMACAQTGAGKTAAYLIPVIQMLMKSDSVYRSGQHQPASPTALVIAPTREMVVQVFCEAKELSQGSMVKPAVLYGGTNPHHQAKDLAAGCNILVATLGRLSDFVARGIVSLRKVKVLVVDEADKLLDIFNLPETQKCIESMPEKGKRQTLMFSGSLPDDIQDAAQDFMHDYAFLTVGRVDASTEGVVQKVFKVDKYDKRGKLEELINDPARDPRERLMIFTETKRIADFLAFHLSQEGFPATRIHGGMKQEDRETALDEFRVGVMSILVATGVAARGLSGLNVAHIINYDMTDDIDEYLNRIGNIDVDHGKVSTFIDVAIDYDLDFEEFSKLMTAEEANAMKLIEREARTHKEDEDWG